MENKKRFWAGGFLYNPKTNRVLLQKRDSKAPINPNKWGFFGGAGENGETPEECFIREFKEELGVDINPESLVPLCDYLNEDYGTWRHVFYVKSSLKKSEMTLGEGENFEWTPLYKAIGYDATNKTLKDLQMFSEMLKSKE